MALSTADIEKGAKVREVYEDGKAGPGKPLKSQPLGVIVKVNYTDSPDAVQGDVESIVVDFGGGKVKKFCGTNTLVLHQRADVAALDALKGEGQTRVVADTRPERPDALRVEKTGKIKPNEV